MVHKKILAIVISDGLMVYPTGTIEKTAVINFKTFDNNENKKDTANEKTNKTIGIVFASLFGATALAGGSYVVYRVIRKKRKGY